MAGESKADGRAATERGGQAKESHRVTSRLPPRHAGFHSCPPPTRSPSPFAGQRHPLEPRPLAQTQIILHSKLPRCLVTSPLQMTHCPAVPSLAAPPRLQGAPPFLTTSMSQTQVTKRTIS